jgi:hypothetical protein
MPSDLPAYFAAFYAMHEMGHIILETGLHEQNRSIVEGKQSYMAEWHPTDIYQFSNGTLIWGWRSDEETAYRGHFE